MKCGRFGELDCFFLNEVSLQIAISSDYSIQYGRLFLRRKERVMRSKITVVGAGCVGRTLVQRLGERDYADDVSYDSIPNMPQGKGLGMRPAGPVPGHDASVVGPND